MGAKKKAAGDVRYPVMFRMSGRERAAAQKQANAEGLSLTEWIRDCMRVQLGRKWPTEQRIQGGETPRKTEDRQTPRRAPRARRVGDGAGR